jgi:hypothetical protein
LKRFPGFKWFRPVVSEQQTRCGNDDTSQLVNIRERKDIVKAGLNWKFGWGAPAVARY